jgi:hypothetical protein
LQQAQWHRREPAAWKVLEAIGEYNRHQLRFPEWFERGEPLATAGIAGSERPELIPLLDRLASWKLQFNVVWDASPGLLRGEAEAVRDAILRHESPLEVQAPEPVCWRAIRQPGRLLVHFVNYAGTPQRPFALRYRGRVDSAAVLIPEEGKVRSLGQGTTVPEFPVHAIVRLDTGV